MPYKDYEYRMKNDATLGELELLVLALKKLQV